MRSVRVSSMVFHAHLTSLQDCPEAPGEEKFEVSARSSPISPDGNVGRSLVGSGVGSVSFRVATGSGFAPKNLLESVWEMSACKCTSTLSIPSPPGSTFGMIRSPNLHCRSSCKLHGIVDQLGQPVYLHCRGSVRELSRATYRYLEELTPVRLFFLVQHVP